MPSLNIANFGPIKDANLEFGDLTVLVGPQASGKSIALQLLKLVLDAGQAQEELGRYGLDWDSSLPRFLDIYFGEGMSSLWRKDATRVEWKRRPVDLKKLASRRQHKKDESLFFIPAQRVLALRDGWPRPFTDYSPGDPFVVREFSERLRLLMEQELGANGDVFPEPRRMRKEFRSLLQAQVFSDFALRVDKSRSQKRLVLGRDGDQEPLPYMVWSAGQREFVPLLLGLYCLMPRAAVARRNGIEWLVLEELEMGLHPRAISVVVLLVFELLKRGYRVCLPTHSPQVLDAIWALKHLRENGAEPAALIEVFDAGKSASMHRLAKSALSKNVKVFYFDRDNGTTRDISDLDPTSEEHAEGGWGGLAEFSGRANAAVAHAVANAKKPRRGKVHEL